MRAKYKQILVRFREDDPDHMEAWNYIHAMSSRNKASADVIAGLVKEKDRGGSIAPASEKQILMMLSDVQHLCRDTNDRISRGAVPPVDVDMVSNNAGREESQGEAGVEAGILSFALDMGD